MDKPEEPRRYKWSTPATDLLVSIWCHDLVQKQLKTSTRNQPIWESIARYMSRKGYSVTGLQCRTRIKNMLCNYHESVRKNEVTGSEAYYDIFKKVLENKKPSKKGKRIQLSPDISYSENEEASLLDGDKQEASTTGGQNKIELLDISNNESQATVNSLEEEEEEEVEVEENEDYIEGEKELSQFESVISKAIDKQTNAITNAINLQSQIIEKLLVAEREKLNMILTSERVSRQQLELKLDKLLEKFEVNIVPHVTYMGTLIETRPTE